jgi:hypothetical protein
MPYSKNYLVIFLDRMRKPTKPQTAELVPRPRFQSHTSSIHIPVLMSTPIFTRVLSLGMVRI